MGGSIYYAILVQTLLIQAEEIHRNSDTKFIDDFFFFADPHQFGFTHFPHCEDDLNYHKWQLREDPISLDTFLSQPYLSPSFFELSLELATNIKTVWTIHDSGVLKIKSAEPMLYKVILA